MSHWMPVESAASARRRTRQLNEGSTTTQLASDICRATRRASRQPACLPASSVSQPTCLSTPPSHPHDAVQVLPPTAAPRSALQLVPALCTCMPPCRRWKSRSSAWRQATPSTCGGQSERSSVGRACIARVAERATHWGAGMALAQAIEHCLLFSLHRPAANQELGRLIAHPSSTLPCLA